VAPRTLLNVDETGPDFIDDLPNGSMIGKNAGGGGGTGELTPKLAGGGGMKKKSSTLIIAEGNNTGN
jgi:hypothetical protein